MDAVGFKRSITGSNGSVILRIVQIVHLHAVVSENAEHACRLHSVYSQSEKSSVFVERIVIVCSSFLTCGKVYGGHSSYTEAVEFDSIVLFAKSDEFSFSVEHNAGNGTHVNVVFVTHLESVLLLFVYGYCASYKGHDLTFEIAAFKHGYTLIAVFDSVISGCADCYFIFFVVLVVGNAVVLIENNDLGFI